MCSQFNLKTASTDVSKPGLVNLWVTQDLVLAVIIQGLT